MRHAARMPLDTGFLTAYIAALQARMVNEDYLGTDEMQDGSTSQKFSSMDDMWDALNRAQAQLDRLTATGGQGLYRRARVVGLPNGPVSQNGL